MQSEQFHQYVIIGAGISGLQAAMILSEQQKDFIILEATSVLGGRIGTQTFAQILQKQSINPSFGVYQNQPSWVNSKLGVLNVPIQYGATWVAQSHSYMKKLIKSLSLEIFPQDREGLIIYGVKPGKYDSLKTYTQLYDKQTRQQVSTLLNKIEKLKNKFNKLYQQAIQKQYKDKIQQYESFVNKYDTISVQEFIRKQLNDDELAGQLTNFIQCLQCISCDKFSMMQLIDDSDSLAIVQQTVQDQGSSGQDQSDDGYRIKTGTLSIIRGMFQAITKNVSMYKQNATHYDTIRFNQPVAKIESWENKNNKQCRVHARGPNGTKVYRAKRILNSIPLATLNKVQITNISRGKSILFNGQELGNVHRVYMVFEQPFWRGKYSGYGSFGPKFPFNQMTDITPENNKCGVLVFVFYVDKYHKWIQQNPDPSQRFSFLKGVVADMMLKGDKTSKYLQGCYTFVRTFENHQYIRASYQPTTKMGVWKAIQQAGDQYGQTFQRDQNGVHYIGSQFDEDYGSYMQGGLRITRKKVFQLLSKPDPWKK